MTQKKLCKDSTIKTHIKKKKTGMSRHLLKTGDMAKRSEHKTVQARAL